MYFLPVSLAIFLLFLCLVPFFIFILPAVAYISGVMGILIGADLLRLHQLKKFGISFLSIGGAGVFDGIFIVGIISVLLV